MHLPAVTLLPPHATPHPATFLSRPQAARWVARMMPYPIPSRGRVFATHGTIAARLESLRYEVVNQRSHTGGLVHLGRYCWPTVTAPSGACVLLSSDDVSLPRRAVLCKLERTADGTRSDWRPCADCCPMPLSAVTRCDDLKANAIRLSNPLPVPVALPVLRWH